MTTPSGRPPAALPLRVLVKGSSLVLKPPDREQSFGEYTFPRHVEDALARRGIPATVWNAGVVGERTVDGFAAWEAQVLAWTPDVVVLGYGYYECIHGFLPHWFERLANPEIKKPGALRDAGRRLLVRPAYKAAAQVQRFVEEHLWRRRTPTRRRRVVRRYAAMIERTRRAGDPLVLVLGLLGPNERATGWFPGMAGRIEAMNTALEQMVADFGDPSVRLLPVIDLTTPEPDEDPGADPVPDGLHYNPRLRRRIAEVVTEHCLERARFH